MDKSITYLPHLVLSEEEMIEASSEFADLMHKRRTVRSFSSKSIKREIIVNCIRAAGSAPSGANMQPWHFVIVSEPAVKKEIRLAAEKVEKEFYDSKAPAEWLTALSPLGTNAEKPFLETAPYLIVIFEKKHNYSDDGQIIKHYYTKESVGIATGILITALHKCGISTLTHTPAPMNFLNEILKRPSNEKPFLILVCGFAETGVTVPDINRKPLDEILTII